MPDPDHEHDLSILDEMLAAEDAGFTPWELTFLESMDKRRGQLKFSEGQSDVLIRIYKERMP